MSLTRKIIRSELVICGDHPGRAQSFRFKEEFVTAAHARSREIWLMVPDPMTARSSGVSATCKHVCA